MTSGTLIETLEETSRSATAPARGRRSGAASRTSLRKDEALGRVASSFAFVSAFEATPEVGVEVVEEEGEALSEGEREVEEDADEEEKKGKDDEGPGRREGRRRERRGRRPPFPLPPSSPSPEGEARGGGNCVGCAWT